MLPLIFVYQKMATPGEHEMKCLINKGGQLYTKLKQNRSNSNLKAKYKFSNIQYKRSEKNLITVI